MKIFFDRFETDKEIVVIYKPYFLYFLAVALVFWGVADQLPQNDAMKTLASFFWFTAIAVVVWRYISMREVWGEMREAMTKGAVVMSGSKFNPANPLTVRIPKSLTNNPST